MDKSGYDLGMLIRYVGASAKTLIDVAALEPGTEFNVADDFGQRLLDAFPGEYEIVADGPVDPAPVVEAPATEDTTTDAPVKSKKTSQDETVI
jgi:hypothetical protein